MTSEDLTYDDVNALREADRKGIMFWMHGQDIEIIERMRKRYGCTTSAAIRACIRIADEVKLSLDHEAPTKGE